jgi:hypothetical protein
MTVVQCQLGKTGGSHSSNVLHMSADRSAGDIVVGQLDATAHVPAKVLPLWRAELTAPHLELLQIFQIL